MEMPKFTCCYCKIEKQELPRSSDPFSNNRDVCDDCAYEIETENKISRVIEEANNQEVSN